MARLVRKNAFIEPRALKRVQTILGRRRESEAIREALAVVAFRADVMKGYDRAAGKAVRERAANRHAEPSRLEGRRRGAGHPVGSRAGIPQPSGAWPPNDVLIALTARAIGAAVVTRNETDFRLVQQVRSFALEVV